MNLFLSRMLTSSLMLCLSITAQLCYAENINGTWSFVSLFGNSPYHYDMAFSESGGVISGTGGNGGWTITGSISGNQVSWREDYVNSSYYADRVGTISGDTMSGTWSNQSQNGAWTSTRIAGSAGNGGTSGNNRSTAIQLFCNRSGPNLETAKCSVTLADQGPPPRILPTGQVDFVATGGFSPGAASCQITQTQYSPGIASCEAQFVVPSGFTIGAKFPIEVTYTGDTNFDPSSTSHELIVSSCVGDVNTPCSGAVALGLTDNQILNNKLKAIIGCGKIISKAQMALALPTGNCSANADLGVPMSELIDNLDEVEWDSISDSISTADAKNDALLKLIKDIGKRSNDELLPTVENSLKHAQEMMKANNEYLKKHVLKNSAPLVKTDTLKKLVPLRSGAFMPQAVAQAPNVVVAFGKVQAAVKKGTQKNIIFKLSSRAKKFVSLFKKADITFIPIQIDMSYVKPGTKKPKKITSEIVRIGLS